MSWEVLRLLYIYFLSLSWWHAGAQGLAGTNYVWVQCDLCDKWRELPKGHQVRLDQKIYT